MKKEYAKFIRLRMLPSIWCPGCGNGIVLGSFIRAFYSSGIDRNSTVVVSGIGCTGRISQYLDFDTVHTTHGRALALATGIKLANPRLHIVVFMGDGDAVAIGGNHFIHAARRNIDLTSIIINNAIYGMTGGQMAPTTLVGQKSSTSPYGRDPKFAGYPLKVSEMLATLKGTRYIERTALNNIANLNKTKKAIKKALELQENGEGFSLVEILSPCPTNWGMTPPDAMDWLEKNLIPEYPLGVFKDKKPEEE